MTKQGKIREGVKAELEKHLYLPVDANEDSKLKKDIATNEFLDTVLSYLHSQGVVIIDPDDPYSTIPLVEE